MPFGHRHFVSRRRAELRAGSTLVPARLSADPARGRADLRGAGRRRRGAARLDGDVDPAHARHATVPHATLHRVHGGWHLLPLSIDGASAQLARSAFLDIGVTPD